MVFILVDSINGYKCHVVEWVEYLPMNWQMPGENQVQSGNKSRPLQDRLNALVGVYAFWVLLVQHNLLFHPYKNSTEYIVVCA